MKVLFILIFSWAGLPAFANSDKILELEKQLKSLSEEVLKLKTQSQVPELGPSPEFSGLGSSASKVYSKSGLSIGGYGELMYSSPRGPKGASSDALRLVPYIGYKFSDTIVFNSEIEFEHGGVKAGGTTGEVIVEFAYLDFLLSSYASIRVGHQLIPLGRTNLKHEPTYFYSANRPEIEKNIIPSTWHENGLMLFGEINSLSYKLGVVNSLDLSTDTAEQSSWIRNSRQKGAKAESEDLSYFLRLDYEFMAGNSFGASYYTGNSTHDASARGDGTVAIYEAHLDYKYRDLILNALYVNGTLSDTDLILDQSSEPLGSEVEGYYLTLAYDLKNILKHRNSIIPFVRYSEYDLHKDVKTGQTRNKSLAKERTTFGLSYYPNHQVVLKMDYQVKENDLGNEADVFNLSMGFVF